MCLFDCREHVHDVRGYALSVVAIFVVLATRVQPLWLIAAGALTGLVGFV